MVGAVVGPPPAVADEHRVTDRHGAAGERLDTSPTRGRGAGCSGSPSDLLVGRLGDHEDQRAVGAVGAQAPGQHPRQLAVVLGRRDVGPHGQPDPAAALPAEAEQHDGLPRPEAQQVRQAGRDLPDVPDADAERLGPPREGLGVRRVVDRVRPCRKPWPRTAATEPATDHLWTTPPAVDARAPGSAQNWYCTALRPASHGRTCSAMTAWCTGSCAYRRKASTSGKSAISTVWALPVGEPGVLGDGQRGHAPDVLARAGAGPRRSSSAAPRRPPSDQVKTTT